LAGAGIEEPGYSLYFPHASEGPELRAFIDMGRRTLRLGPRRRAIKAAAERSVTKDDDAPDRRLAGRGILD
jgi:hypothetical protein